MKFGIVVFPGSNCDHDAWYATSHNAGAQAQMLWHKDTIIPADIDCVILPGGFSYGDYLRCGAIARVYFQPLDKRTGALLPKAKTSGQKRPRVQTLKKNLEIRAHEKVSEVIC